MMKQTGLAIARRLLATLLEKEHGLTLDVDLTHDLTSDSVATLTRVATELLNKEDVVSDYVGPEGAEYFMSLAQALMDEAVVGDIDMFSEVMNQLYDWGDTYDVWIGSAKNVE
jgi:alanyl-tRNA synthetase